VFERPKETGRDQNPDYRGSVVIEFVITLLVVTTLWTIVGWKTRRMNNDAKQRELVELLLTVGQMYRIDIDPITATSDVRAYFRAQGWNTIQIAWRMAHAVSFVEHTPTLRLDYKNVLVVWRSFKDGAW
jgi:hypothetical protein